ncbi:MAG: UvrD-helicase domain-containing protein [Bacilli bacterium]|nr:UvrD-helicase domain-containing protein [Bacilli bacterium]
MGKWTSDQEQAITKTGTNIIVSAGAGSGKTAVLTERTIRKLLNGGNINRLLILTFTNAAAGEMKERIRKAIKKAGLKEQLDYIDSSYITTFDSFALSLVKKYHTLLKLSPNISILDNSIEILKTNEIIDDIFDSMYGDENFEKLINDFCIKSDDNIKEIVKEISKKLDLIPEKSEYLENYINTHFNDEFIDREINKYLNIIKQIKESINEPYKELISRVNNKFIETFNLDPLINSNTYDDIKTNISLIGSPRKNKECLEDYKIYKDEITSIIKKLKDLTRFESIDEMKQSLLSTKPYIIAISNIINKFDKEFNKYKKEHDLYTFADIALMAIKILKENKDIREDLKNSFDEIMVDEYQDTSDVQEEFINLIANNNLYMVGDIKQSIYRFRHANPYIFRNKYKDYSNGNGGIKIDLLKNFRSREEVLNNINLIFNLIMDENIGDAEYKVSHQMNFGNTNYIESCKTNQNNNMEILTYNPKEIEDFSNDEVEAFTICYDIKEKIENKYLVVDRETNKLRECKYSDFAIIMDRGTSFDLYKKIFEYVGVPILQIKNEKLSLGDDLTVLKNLINLIVKINLNEIDDEFKYYFTSVSRSYLFKTIDEDIFDIIKNNKYYESELYSKCKKINIFEISNLDLINKIIEEFNYYEKLITIGNIKESMIKIDYLKDLSINLSNIGYTPIDFAKYLSDMIDSGAIEYSLNSDNSNTVKILNIHKSKGLEYSICYFSGLFKRSNDEDKKAKFIVDSKYNIITPYVEDGIKQTILKDLLIDLENKESISEKIRLFYVALTRAREKFIIVCPLDKESDGYNTLVPNSIRLNYNRISDMLESIIPVLIPYIKDIDFNKVILTRDFEKIKTYNYKEKIEKTDVKIQKIRNDIEYKELNESRFSKVTNKLITKDEYNNMKEGTRLHYIFETEDFKTSNNPYILKFVKQIDLNYINCFKEYEFIYNEDNEIKHGFIDLMLEYEKSIDIIDYKMKNITDENYLKQLNGYKTYIESISEKEVNIYLYSILDNTLLKLRS